MTSPLIGPKPNLTQNIKYSGPDLEYSTEIKGDNVVIHCGQGTHNHGSCKVKLIDRIDYNWEFGYYHGKLVAAHINGKVVAFGLKGKDGGMVRVTNQETNHRALIKNLKEDIKDLAFAYSRESIILGCVDTEGNILIYQIEDTSHSISYKILLHIYHRNNHPHSNYKLIWCPYMPNFEDETDSGDDPEKMFVVLNGSKAQIYNAAMLEPSATIGTPLEPNETSEGYIEINHTAELVDASFSADGTAIAIASVDGFVKFFQLYLFDREQKCLHEWRPHNGAPLSSIIFIDNVLEYSSECWKFTITGANNNSELKLWSCESWTCLQTIHFKPDPKSPVSGLFLHVAIDYTGQYVLISDINNRVAYVMQLKRFDKEQTVYVESLAQFLLPAPFLSFHIIEANTKNLVYSFHNSNEDIYDDREDFDEEAEVTVVSVKMLVIQPKKFQECNIVFQPESLFYDTLPEPLPEVDDLNIADEKDAFPKLDDLQESVNLLIQQHSNSSLALMTPGNFTPQGHSSRPNSEIASITKEVLDENVENLIDFERPQKENFASGGSSPSREVQEILSLNNSAYNSTQDYFDNLTKIQDEVQEEPQKEYSKPSEPLLYPEGDVLWPKVPVVTETEIIKDETLLKELRLSAGGGDDKSNLQTLTYRISTLENLLREQNILLQKLHQDRMDKAKFFEEMDCALSKQQLQIAKMLENFVSVQKKMERGIQEEMVTNVTQVLTKSLAEKMQQVVSHEMKHAILPAIHNLMDSYRVQMDGQYSQKLANMDVMLRENVAKAFNSKSLADSLSASVVHIVAPSLEKCYRDIIASSLIPSWEKVCGQMFQQINETFTRGTKEYTASVENYMDKQRRVQEKGKDLIVQMQAVSESMRTNADKLTSALTSEIHKQFNTIFKTMQDKLTQNIKEIVSEQVKQGFKSHASVIEEGVMNVVRSRAVTPSPHVDPHITTVTQIRQFLSRGNYDEAFHVALNAENLSYVIFVCEQVNIQTLFSEECKLNQTCLLSLIQQLSVELHKNTDLKLKYIQAAFLALSPNNIKTKHFMPELLKDLLKQLNNFIVSNQSNKHVNEAKLLKIGVEGMLVQCHQSSKNL